MIFIRTLITVYRGFGITGTIVIFPERKGRDKTGMNGYHASWSRKDHPRNIERIGRG
jgi:hypothetical protein